MLCARARPMFPMFRRKAGKNSKLPTYQVALFCFSTRGASLALRRPLSVAPRRARHCARAGHNAVQFFLRRQCLQLLRDHGADTLRRPVGLLHPPPVGLLEAAAHRRGDGAIAARAVRRLPATRAASQPPLTHAPLLLPPPCVTPHGRAARRSRSRAIARSSGASPCPSFGRPSGRTTRS